MYNNRVEIICKISLILILIFVLILLVYYAHQRLINTPNKQIYFNFSAYNETQGYNGFNYHNHYFCVITAGRSNKDIIETTIHELAHLLVDSNDKHFMENYNKRKELKE